MEQDELIDEMETVFRKQTLQKIQGYSYRSLDVETDIKKAILQNIFDIPEESIRANPEKYELDFPTSNTLIKIFRKIEGNKKLEEVYRQYLYNAVSKTKQPVLALATLFKLGELTQGLSKVSTEFLSGENREQHVQFLIDLIKYEYPKIRREEFNKLDSIMLLEIKDGWSDQKKKMAHVLELVTEVKYKRLEEELLLVNTEINEDKKRVIEKLNRFGFNPELEKCLYDIDSIINKNECLEEALISGLIKNLREFMGILTKQIAESIKKKTGEPYPKPKDNTEKEMGIIRKYLKDKLQLNEKDNKLLDAFIDILNIEGGHAFTSEKKYLRLTKNLAIEFAYFLLSKYEEAYEIKS